MTKRQRGTAPRQRRTTVAHESLVPGTILTATLKGQVFSSSAIAGEDDRPPEVEFNGQRYPSPSAAGKAAAGYAVNGWRFWKKVAEGDSC